jgi:autotransporter passenger strand-loop-strand repeat protein
VTGTIRAEVFEQSIGVNVHVEYTDGKYANAKNVVADLAYLGIDHVRDATLNPSNQGQWNYGVLAAAGIKFDMIVMGENISTSLSLLNTFEEEHPGSISAIEGPNEINNQPVTYDGLTGNSAGVAYQNALYAAVESDKTLSNLPVYSLTGNTTAGEATYVNVHAYPKSGNQPYSTLSYDLSMTPGLSSASGAVLTEAGYYTLTDGVGWGGVDEHTQATMTLNLLMDATKLGYSQTYLYQLLDAYSDPTGTNTDAAFGMFDLSNNPKPVAVAIHNLMEILDDTGSKAATFATGTLNYNISGLPSTGSSLLMEKSDGAYDIVVWNEPHAWDSATESEVAVAPTNVTVNLGGTFTSASVYDPLTGTTSIETVQNASSIQISVTDHPLIIEVGGAETGAGTSPAMSNSSGATVGAGNNLIVSSGGITGGSITAGGTETVYSTGELTATIVSSGGLLNVSSGGAANAISVLKGGILEVYAGAATSGSLLVGGGEGVQGGGVDNGATLFSGGYLNLHSGGTAKATKVLNGGNETVLSGGRAAVAVVSSGGLLNVSSGGLANAISVLKGGILEVYAGAATSGVVLIGGGEGLQGGGVDSGATLSSGGYLNLHSGGAANATNVLNGGNETVLSGGLASGAVISSGGLLNVSAGGVADATSVLSGATVETYARGTAYRSLLVGGGEGIQSGGVDIGAVLSNGGYLNVHYDGLASATDVLSGGMETVLSGGVLADATVMSGGVLVISSGATVKSGLTLSGGTEMLLGAVANGVAISFATSGGELVLGDAPAFSGTIAGMHDSSERVDLGGFDYSSSEKISWTEAANNTSGVLTIVDGSKTAKLALVGSYVKGNFVLSADGAGGTIVVDPVVQPPATKVHANSLTIVQAMASFGAEGQTAVDSSRFAAAAPIFLGEPVLSPGATSSAGHR